MLESMAFFGSSPWYHGRISLASKMVKIKPSIWRANSEAPRHHWCRVKSSVIIDYMLCDWSKYEDIFWSRCSAEKWTEGVIMRMFTQINITEGWTQWAVWGYTEVVQPRCWRNVCRVNHGIDKVYAAWNNHISISNVGPMLAKVCI